jgi:hypothetical protein
MERGKETRDLLDAAERLPGVAEVAEVYGAFAKYAPILVPPATVVTHLQTGANA